jgi:hypothetical protein
MSEVYMATSDETQSAATCREAVDLIVDRIQRACQDAGGAEGERFVVQEDVVGWVLVILHEVHCFYVSQFRLTEAQRMTSVYAKMEYGVKRLLWLGS